MTKKVWNDYDGVEPIGFNKQDIVEVEYRDGRKAMGNEPWMFSGWQWWPGDGASRDIVKWRLVKAGQ